MPMFTTSSGIKSKTQRKHSLYGNLHTEPTPKSISTSAELEIHGAFFNQKLISVKKKKITFGLLAEDLKYTTMWLQSDFVVKTDRATNSVHCIDTAEQPDITGIQTKHPNRGRFICDSRLSSR